MISRAAVVVQPCAPETLHLCREWDSREFDFTNVNFAPIFGDIRVIFDRGRVMRFPKRSRAREREIERVSCFGAGRERIKFLFFIDNKITVANKHHRQTGTTSTGFPDPANLNQFPGTCFHQFVQNVAGFHIGNTNFISGAVSWFSSAPSKRYGFVTNVHLRNPIRQRQILKRNVCAVIVSIAQRNAQQYIVSHNHRVFGKFPSCNVGATMRTGTAHA